MILWRVYNSLILREEISRIYYETINHTPLEARPAPTSTPAALAPRRPAARRDVPAALSVAPPIASSIVPNAGTAEIQTNAAIAKNLEFILKHYTEA